MLSLWFVWFIFYRGDGYWGFTIEDMISYLMFSTGWIRKDGFWREHHEDYMERLWRFGYRRFCITLQMDK